jgi:hypothetical protein
MMSFGKLLKKFGLLFCQLGIHDFHVIDINFTFGASGNIEKIQCQRCGLVVTRTVRD